MTAYTVVMKLDHLHGLSQNKNLVIINLVMAANICGIIIDLDLHMKTEFY